MARPPPHTLSRQVPHSTAVLSNAGSVGVMRRVSMLLTALIAVLALFGSETRGETLPIRSTFPPDHK